MNLPIGTLTFLFTDIEGSTRLWEREPEVMQAVVARHDALLNEIVKQYGGSVVKTTGDGMLAVFASAPDAVGAALAIQRALRDEPWDAAIGRLWVRAALHTGTAELRGGDYFGTAVNRAARLLSAGHGGQTLLSQSTWDLLQDHLPEVAALHFLGEYRLRDLTRPERVYQLNAPDLPADFPPLRTRSLRPDNLPAELSSFVGREREIAEVERLLESARLITLTGPGGVGKTRLGQRIAASAAGKFADGITFVALATTSDPELVPSTIAKALGIVEQPNRPVADSVKRYLRDRWMLLVLDSYEHLLETASLVSELLSAAPRLSVLVTSREILHLSGEHEYPVPPLTVPDPLVSRSMDDLSAYESVKLFLQRAGAASPNFRLTEDNALAVANVCARLDGLPLAIELAAARTKLFSPQQILERLDHRLDLLKSGPRDLPARQRTLRRTIEWSHDLLDKDDQQLFARLGVFSGGRSPSAVEAVCGPGLGIDTRDGLESLLDKSLLYVENGPGGEPRFMMLETIHEFARERLSQSNEERQIRERHLAYFLALAEEMEPGYYRHGQQLQLVKTEAELDNFRSAFDWALDNDNLEAAARVVSAIDYFFRYRDRFIEGYSWINRVLEINETISSQYWLRFLAAAGRLAWANNDLVQSRLIGQEALLLARETNDRRGEAYALAELGTYLIGQPELREKALSYVRDGLAIFREIDDEPGTAWALNGLGELERAAKNYEGAQKAYEECMTISRSIGDVIRQNVTLENLTFVANHKGEHVYAKELAMEVIKQWADVENWKGLCNGLSGLAGAVGKLGEPTRAARLLGASAARLAELGFAYQASDQHEVAKYTVDVRAQLGEARFETAWTEGQAMTLDETIAYALESEGSGSAA